MRSILNTIAAAAIVALVATSLDQAKRIAVLESGPRANEIITRLVTIETELRQLSARMAAEDTRRERERENYRRRESGIAPSGRL